MTKVFCAIDTPDMDRARAMVTQVADTVYGFKFGLEFYTALGPAGVHELRKIVDEERKFFLDLKLHDIPNTVAGAVRAATRCGVEYLTIHAAGGTAMMKAALDAARDAEQATGFPAPRLLGVTVLTSLDDADLKAAGVEDTAEKQVLRLARLARDAGLAGVVCAPHEIAPLRAALGGSVLLVTPGIRPAGVDRGDQKRTMTPGEAAAAGADYLVIGRAITGAQDPAQAARSIAASLAA